MKIGFAMLAILVGCGDKDGAVVDAPPGSGDGLVLPDTSEPAMRLPYRGVNLSGAEFGSNVPGTFGTDYIYPDSMYASGYQSPAYFASKGATMFRLPFLWERLQRTLGGDLDATELARLDATIDHLTALGTTVLLDPHDYARYSGAIPSNAQFADFWSKLAAHYKNHSGVAFGLMNEPHDLPTTQWRDLAQAAITAIRATGANNLVTVPGVAYTGAWSWTDNYYGTPNGDVMGDITDPANNFVFEVHQYLDGNYSGTNPACQSQTIGASSMAALTAWLEQHHARALVGEFGAGDNPDCATAIDGLLAHLEAHTDVYVGWLWWSAGPWWGDDYFLSLEPRANGTDAPQLATLAPHFAFH